MFQFYGIIDWSGHGHERDHGNSLDTIRRKFPSRSASFELIQQEGLLLFGTGIRTAQQGSVQILLIGEILNPQDELKTGDSLADLPTSLLHYILDKGEPAVANLNGSFIIILIDRVARTCRIINDQLGVLQLFYHATRDYVLFASELKYLFCHDACPRRIDWVSSLKRHIPFLVINAEHHYEAWFKDIFLMQEASVLEIDASGKHTQRQYWNPWSTSLDTDQVTNLDATAINSYTAQYLDILDDAVRLRCTTPGSAYAMFSGGLDSTIVAALARKYVDVETFSFATQATSVCAIHKLSFPSSNYRWTVSCG